MHTFEYVIVFITYCIRLGHATVMGKTKNAGNLTYRPGEFVIKVQGPLDGGGNMMVYDEKRTFRLSLDLRESPGKFIANLTKKFSNPYPGNSTMTASMKAFVYARIENGGLRVFIDRLAPWQSW